MTTTISQSSKAMFEPLRLCLVTKYFIHKTVIHVDSKFSERNKVSYIFQHIVTKIILVWVPFVYYQCENVQIKHNDVGYIDVGGHFNFGTEE